MQQDMAIVRNKVPGEIQKQSSNEVVDVEGDLEVGDDQRKRLFFPTQSCETFECQSPGGVEGTFPVIVKKFHSPFISFPRNSVLPLS